MSQADVKPVLDWREIAARVAVEKDSKKVLDLAQELIRRLDAETSTRLEHITVEDKTPQDGAA